MNLEKNPQDEKKKSFKEKLMGFVGITKLLNRFDTEYALSQLNNLPENLRTKALEDLKKGFAAKNVLDDIYPELVKQRKIEAEEFNLPIELIEDDMVDRSFEGKIIHKLALKPLSKEQAIEMYKKTGRDFPSLLENEMPYIDTKAEELDVLIIKALKKKRASHLNYSDYIEIMQSEGFRPMRYEELIQFISSNPKCKEEVKLLALGTRHTFGKNLEPSVACAYVNQTEQPDLKTSFYIGGLNEGERLVFVRI